MSESKQVYRGFTMRWHVSVEEESSVVVRAGDSTHAVRYVTTGTLAGQVRSFALSRC